VRDGADPVGVSSEEVLVVLRRFRQLLGAVPLLGLAVLGACGDAPVQLAGGRIDSTVIDWTGLPDEFDSLTTFTYAFPSVNAESVLVVLLDAGIPVRYGWQPLDNLCADPIGPRFTVQLYRYDSRMLEHDFVRGAVGRLLCATQIMWYQVVDGS
jgi:hypothetical protein